MKTLITIETIVKGEMPQIWEWWTTPKHIMNWAFASSDWECTNATNDLTVRGKFSSTMAAKDKSTSFDFGGTYTGVEEGKYINYMLDDGRKVTVDFKQELLCVHIMQTFEAEGENSEEMQRTGWQAILDNFKRYAEAQQEDTSDKVWTLEK